MGVGTLLGTGGGLGCCAHHVSGCVRYGVHDTLHWMLLTETVFGCCICCPSRGAALRITSCNVQFTRQRPHSRGRANHGSMYSNANKLHISMESRQLAMCRFVVQDFSEGVPPQLSSSDHEKKQVASDEGETSSPVEVNEYNNGAGSAGVSVLLPLCLF